MEDDKILREIIEKHSLRAVKTKFLGTTVVGFKMIQQLEAVKAEILEYYPESVSIVELHKRYEWPIWRVSGEIVPSRGMYTNVQEDESAVKWNPIYRPSIEDVAFSVIVHDQQICSLGEMKAIAAQVDEWATELEDECGEVTIFYDPIDYSIIRVVSEDAVGYSLDSYTVQLGIMIEDLYIRPSMPEIEDSIQPIHDLFEMFGKIFGSTQKNKA